LLLGAVVDHLGMVIDMQEERLDSSRAWSRFWRVRRRCRPGYWVVKPSVSGMCAGYWSGSTTKAVGDVTRAGYNLVNGRSATDTSVIDTASCNSLSCQT